MQDSETKRRSKAGLSTLRRHREKMMPWSYPLFGVIFGGVLVMALFFLGFAPLWAMLAWPPLMLVVYLIWDKETDPINDTWGAGARGEARVGAELEKLHREGFHVFHDWDKGMGNVDHFAVGPQGVFAIETKAWTGEITAEGDRLKRNDKFVYENKPISQAMGNAFAVRKLIGETYGKEPFVVPVLCFSRAEVRSYSRVRKVEVTGIGALTRVIMNRRTKYTTAEVTAISKALEERLGVSPAASPTLPPERPGVARKTLGKVFDLSNSAIVLVAFSVVFALSFIFPAQAAEFLDFTARLYRLLAETI